MIDLHSRQSISCKTGNTSTISTWNKVRCQVKLISYTSLTSTLETHWAVCEVATLWNCHGNLWLDSSTLGCIGKHNCTEAAGVLANALHLKAALIGNSGLLVLCCWRTGGQLKCLPFYRNTPTFPSSINPLKSSTSSTHHHHNQPKEAKVLHWDFDFCSALHKPLPGFILQKLSLNGLSEFPTQLFPYLN